MRSGRFLYIGFIVPDGDMDRIFTGETQPQVSAVRFQRSLIQALVSAGASVEAISTPPIRPYPSNRTAWVPGADYKLADLGVSGHQIAGPNLPIVRSAGRLIQTVRHGLVKLRTPCDGIFVYSVNTPLLIAALLLKKLRRVPVFVFIPDLPLFMGGPSHPVKRLLKRIDDALARRLLARTDGAFPIVQGIGEDWLGRGPRFLPVEGTSDEAAEVLSKARSTAAYVFRGQHRPRLLYTGAMSQLMAFAHLFHRSKIEATVVFMGGGEDFGSLQALSQADSRIEVKGFMIGAELTKEIARADFLLNPRDPTWPGAAYSFPSKLFEYLRAGKPIISTRLRGIPPDYFTVFRAIDLDDQPTFEASLTRALAVDEDPDQIWGSAERLAGRLTSLAVGTKILTAIRGWTTKASHV